MTIDTIIGRQVLLRSPKPSDFSEFTALVRGSKDFLRPWAYPPTGRETFRLYTAKDTTGRSLRWLIVDKDKDAIAGVISVSEITRGALQSAFLGYWLGESFAGRGLMSEAMELTLRHVFRVLKLHRIEANIQPGNRRSVALVKRHGFRKEGFSPKYLRLAGRWRDHERWALLADEWRTRRRR